MVKFLLLTTPINVVCAALDVSFRSRTVASLRDDKVPEADILAGVKDHLSAAIDLEAERLRGLVATPGAGQAMEYNDVLVDAQAAIAAAAASKPIVSADYPMLAVTVGIDIDPQTGAPAGDVLGVARSVIAAYGAWKTFGAEVRGARLKGKVSVQAAASVEAAAAAAEAIAWPALG